jgi:hypothetical protein
LLNFFDISKYDFLVEGAYAPVSRIEFPFVTFLINPWSIHNNKRTVELILFVS